MHLMKLLFVQFTVNNKTDRLSFDIKPNLCKANNFRPDSLCNVRNDKVLMEIGALSMNDYSHA